MRIFTAVVLFLIMTTATVSAATLESKDAAKKLTDQARKEVSGLHI